MLTDHRSGKAPSRSNANITVGFGLVSIPLALYSGTDDGAKIKRSQFTTDGHPVGNRNYDKATGENYDGEIVKKVLLDPDTAIDLTDEEMQAVTGGPQSGLCEITTFIPLEAIGTTYVVTAFNQVRPARITRGRQHFDNPAAAKAFVLLCAAMAESKVAGLLKLALRGPARYAALTPDGHLLTLAFADEVRSDLALPEVELSAGEQAMAKQLVGILGVDTPVLSDDAGVKLHEYVAAKAAGGETAKVEEYQPEVAETSLEALLAMSVAAIPRDEPAEAIVVAA